MSKTPPAYALIMFIVLFVLCFSAKTLACSCSPPPPPCEAFSTSSAMFIGKVVSGTYRETRVYRGQNLK